MKLFLVFASLVLAISASTDEESWLKFKQDHGKTYKSLREDKLRFEIFKSNLRTLEEHNAKYESGEETWFMGVNQFSDLTDEEFEAIYLASVPPSTLKSTGTFYGLNISAPDSVDWRDKGAVLSVKNQGSCGSCWAFSAIASIEGQNAIKHNTKVDLSPQELVDCSRKYGNQGCDGGWMDDGFSYVKDNGISKQSDYAYTGHDDTCKSSRNSAGIRLTGYHDITSTEAALKDAVASIGPISVAINSVTIRSYAGGIFNNLFCGSTLNHGVLAVGYGSESNHDYWIVKNSWGATWGDHGYIKMTRNRFNQCGIASKASYPIIA